jgi:hypothetical protein
MMPLRRVRHRFSAPGLTHGCPVRPGRSGKMATGLGFAASSAGRDGGAPPRHPKQARGRHWHEIHPWLPTCPDLGAHDGNPPPRHEGSRRHLSPSASLRSRGKERVNGPTHCSDRPEVRLRAAPICPSHQWLRVNRIPPGLTREPTRDGRVEPTPVRFRTRTARRPSASGWGRAGRIGTASRRPAVPGRRGARHWHEIHTSLTTCPDVGAHGGNPPPRHEGASRPLPPSAGLSSQGKENVNGLICPRADRRSRSPQSSDRINNIALAVPAAHTASRSAWLVAGQAVQRKEAGSPHRYAASRSARLVTAQAVQRKEAGSPHCYAASRSARVVAAQAVRRKEAGPPGRPACVSRPDRIQGRLHRSLPLSWQGCDHGGSPPPAQKGMRGPPPPSATLASEGEGRVNSEWCGAPRKAPGTRQSPRLAGAVIIGQPWVGPGRSGRRPARDGETPCRA